MSEKVIATATFDPKVKSYWTLVISVICAATLVGLIFTPVIAVIAWLVSDRMLKAMSANLLERKLVVKRGIFFVVEKSIPLEKITDVALSQGPIMRLFGVVRLSFETAGQSAAGALVSLVGINDAAQFREIILAQKDRLSSNKPASNIDENIEISDMQSLVKSVHNIEILLTKLVEKSDNT